MSEVPGQENPQASVWELPPPSVASDFAQALPDLIPQVISAPGEIVSALSEVTKGRQRDREAGA